MRGRKCQYKDYENIVNIKMRSKYRIGDCRKCGAINIRTFNWCQHEHKDWDLLAGKQINQECISQLANVVFAIVQDKGRQILNNNFPLGITSQISTQFYENVAIHLIEGLQEDPHLKYKPNSHHRQQVQSYFMQKDINISEKGSQDQEEQPSFEQLFKAFKRQEPIKDQFVEQVRKKPSIAMPNLFMDQIFREIPIFTTRRAVQLRKIISEYENRKAEAEQIRKELTVSSNRIPSLTNLLKKCFYCQGNFSIKDKNCRQCTFCLTRVHKDCFTLIQNCICANNMRQHLTRVEFQKVYQDPIGIAQSEILRKETIAFRTFKIQTNRLNIEIQENYCKQVLLEKGLFFSEASLAPNDLNLQVLAIDDPFIGYGNHQLEQAYEMYRSRLYKPPLKINRQDKALIAMEDIPSNVFLFQYAGDILPALFAPSINYHQKIVLYALGPTSNQQLIIAHLQCGNWGFFLKNSHDSNCSSIRIVLNNKIRLLIYTNKRIGSSEELIINLNDFYDTKSSEIQAQS